MGRTQITGEEVWDNSLKGVDIDESTLDDNLIPFNETGWVSNNVHAAILESSTGGDPKPTAHVGVGETLTINSDRHHVVISEIVNEGTIINNGGTLGVI